MVLLHNTGQAKERIFGDGNLKAESSCTEHKQRELAHFKGSKVKLVRVFTSSDTKEKAKNNNFIKTYAFCVQSVVKIVC